MRIRLTSTIAFLFLGGCYSPELVEDTFRCVRPGECLAREIRVSIDGVGLGSVGSDSHSFSCEKSEAGSLECGALVAVDGEGVRLRATADAPSGSNFREFLGCDSTEAESVCVFVARAEERSIRASFGYLLRVEVEGEPSLVESVTIRGGDYLGGCAPGAPCENVFIASELVTIEATSTEAGRVAEWVGCEALSDAGLCSVSMNRRHEVRVVFAGSDCGDGMRFPDEGCDDGNAVGADGCSANCEVEAGYVCDDGMISVCTGFIVEPASLQVAENIPSQVTVRMNRAPAQRIVVPIFVAGPEAVLSARELEFKPDDFNETVTVEPSDDNVDEPEKSFLIEFGPISGDPFFENIQIPSISVVKADDDDPPTITIGDAADPEGSMLIFALSLDHPSEFPISVGYEVIGGPVPGFVPPVPNPGTATFDSLATTSRIFIDTIDDHIYESNEIFRIELQEPVIGATIGVPSVGVGTIDDNDAGPELSIGPPSPAAVVEGAASTSFTVSFTITLTPASGQQVSVAWATRDGSATAGADYDAANGVAVFAPGQTTQTVDVTVRGDGVDEVDEDFYVDLSSPVLARLVPMSTSAAAVITDDDVVSMVITSYSTPEPGTGTAPMIFSVILSDAPAETVTVDWEIVAGNAARGFDYVDDSGTLTFLPGITNQTIEVDIRADNVYEDDETFLVVLSNARNANISSAPGTGTIPANGQLPEIRIGSNVSVTEGSVAVTAALIVTLVGATEVPASVDWSTQDFTAAAPGDFTAVTNQRLDFPVGTSSRQIVLTIPVDVLDEDDEIFMVNLDNVNRAGISAANIQRNITILDNDPLPALSIADITVVEPTAGTVNAVLSVTLTPASARVVRVEWETVDNTAIGFGSGRDYEASPGTLSFAPGQTTRTISITIRSGMDPVENFFVNIYDPFNATISDLQAIVTIN